MECVFLEVKICVIRAVFIYQSGVSFLFWWVCYFWQRSYSRLNYKCAKMEQYSQCDKSFSQSNRNERKKMKRKQKKKTGKVK